MKTIVITGSTRGIGFGLADEFLKRGCRVVVSGRTQEAVDEATTRLAGKHAQENFFGTPCNVSNYAEVQRLWDATKANFGKVDIWINNAGISNPYLEFWKLKPEIIKQVVDTNVLGAMYGSHIALNGFLQQGEGELYNMYGFGSDGRMIAGLALYGATKYGLAYLTKSLLKDAEGKNIRIGSISPGIVLTDLWTDLYREQPERMEKSKKFVNILGDKVETVTPYLAEQVLQNTKNGAAIKWLTGGKAFFRFLTAPFNKRDLFSEQSTVNIQQS